MYERVGLHPGVDSPMPAEASRDAGPILSTIAGILVSLAGVMNQAQAQEPEKSTTQLQAILAGLDNPTFLVREQSLAAAQKMLWEEFARDPARARTLLRSATPAHVGGREQRERIATVQRTLWEWQHNLPWALPQEASIQTGSDVMRAVGTQGNVSIHLPPTLHAELTCMSFDLRSSSRESRMTNPLLQQLCERTSSTLRFDDNGCIRMIPCPENERLVASDELLCRVQYDRAGTADVITLYIEPGRGSLLAFMGDNGDYVCSDVCAPPIDQEFIDMRNHRLPPPYLTVPAQWRTPANLHSCLSIRTTSRIPVDGTIRAIVADVPQTVSMTVGGPNQNFGIQSIKIAEPEQRSDSRWSIASVTHFSMGNDTMPTHNDLAAYMLMSVTEGLTRIRFQTADGTELTATREGSDLVNNALVTTYTCMERPVSATVTAHTRVSHSLYPLPAIPGLKKP